MKAARLPGETADCGWYNVLPEPPPARRVDGRVSADWAIVGAGISGLAVARQLATHRPDDKIVLIDATRVGLGASGRNSGFMLNYSAHGSGSGEDHESERRYAGLLQAGVDELRRLVTEHQIRCDWSEWGRLYVAVGADGEKHMAELAQAHERVGAEHRWLDQAERSRVTGSDFYSSALWAGGSTLVQPAALVRGLAQTLPANVTLYEESPVSSIERADGFRLVTDGGEVAAEKLILAAGVYANQLGAFRHRLLGIATYASMTRPLTADEQVLFQGTAEFGLLPASQNRSTVRLTRDHRIVMRNSFSYAGGRRMPAAELSAARANHAESIRQRWPSLAEIELEHTWGGIIAYTRNQGALFGRIDDDVWAVTAGDAGPMTRGTITGKLLADYIVGADSDMLATQLSLGKAGLLPPEPFLGLGVNFRLRSIRRQGRAEI
jgi:glycine/D-amino acid oxidase-like deaminating enzyme